MTEHPLLIAHRGGRDWAPENTLAAFKKSLEAGVDAVEFDVHRCASGELVVIHDHELGRTTNGAGYVRDSRLDDLKRLSAGLWFGQEFAGEQVPLLSEVLDLFQEKILVNIEVKNTPFSYAGIEKNLLSELEPYRKKLKLLVSSFDHHCLARLRALDKHLELGVLAAASLVDLQEYCAKFAASYYIANYSCLLAEDVKDAHAGGLKVMVWTVNEKFAWERLLEMGVDGICTDTPQALKAYLQDCQSAAG